MAIKHRRFSSSILVVYLYIMFSISVSFTMAVRVLGSVYFHVLLWIMMIMGVVGNVMVVLWRCTRPRQQRGSVLSLMIIMLAVADFLYCVHLIILLSAVEITTDGVILFTAPMSRACSISGNLSWLACSAAMWMTLNIAIYSRQELTERNCCSRCCSLVGRKRCLWITIFCQLFFTVLPIIALTITVDSLGNVFGEPDTNLTASEFLTQCSYAQSSQPLSCVYDGVNYREQCKGLNQLTIANAAALASLNAVLCVSCAFLYLSICMYIRKQVFRRNDRFAVHSSSVEEFTTLQWRLALIVFIDVVTWLPVTVIHCYSMAIVIRDWYGSEDRHYPTKFQDLTATNLVLVSVGHAVNPLVYTIAGRQFVQFVKGCWRYLRCRVSFHCSEESTSDDYRIGIRRCSWIPCIRCIRPWEYLDSVQWDTENTSPFSSDDDQSDS